MTSALRVDAFGTTFQNPVLLAAGTCGFGRELADVVDLEALGGLVTKSVTPEPRAGNPSPRVAELDTGMMNSIGLANPGLAETRRSRLPWLARHLSRARVLVSVAGHAPEHYVDVVRGLDGEDGFLGFELNLSCPNDTRLEGRPFALDPEALVEVVGRCREATDRPLSVKLAPNDPELAASVARAEEAGADGITLVNTLPGLAYERRSGRPTLGAGGGGVSGPALRPIGMRAVAEARAATELPIFGVGGVLRAEHAVDYLRAGATLVQVGTATFADPRAAERIVRRLPGALARGGVDLARAGSTESGADRGSAVEVG